MKTYQFKNAISIICFVITGFCITICAMCIAEWHDTLHAIISTALSLIYLVIGLCAKYGAMEDYDDYLTMKSCVKENCFDRLVYLFRKYKFLLDLNLTIPLYSDKQKVIAWAVDVAVSCQAYQHDYNTAKTDPILNHDLDLMIELANQLIDNKKYI